MTTVHRRRGRRVLAAALTALTFLGVMYSPVAVAEPNSDSWDIGEFDYCVKQTGKGLDGADPLDIPEKVRENQRYCCDRSGGVWNGSSCVAPAGDSSGAQQVPGNIELAPVAPVAPPRAEPPRAPSSVPVFTPPAKCPPDGRDGACRQPVS